MFKVNVDGNVLYGEKGETLSDILIRNNMAVEHPCGGKGTCGKCIVLVNGKAELSCKYEVAEDITVSLPEKQEIESQSGAEITGEYTDNMCFVLDIGTTTLALALVSLDDKKIIKVITRNNPQRLYGADVMTRIDYCRKNSVDSLQTILIEEINKMVGNFYIPQSLKMYVAGNTTMVHIFLGVDPSSIGVSPYTPTFLESKCVKGEKIGLNVHEIISLPSISAFVGADLVAGMNFTGMPSNHKYNLLIDLGTNAEVVLYSKGNILCTAAAAGPCFEGANITCGMSATDGAIYSFAIKDKIPQIETIAKGDIKGICGTGLVDMISELVKIGEIDETGFMECEEYYVTKDVFLNQKDVRQFQLAKSAVCSAVMTLMNMAEISFEDVEKMFISGGFSAKINVDNACFVGLLPTELKEKCVPINNSSLLGAVKYACEQNDLSQYVDNSKYVDLSTNAMFMDVFIENMEFFSEKSLPY